MREFEKQFKKVCRELETLAEMVNDSENLQEYLNEQGCWEDTYHPEFNIIDYLNQYYKSLN